MQIIHNYAILVSISSMPWMGDHDNSFANKVEALPPTGEHCTSLSKPYKSPNTCILFGLAIMQWAQQH